MADGCRHNFSDEFRKVHFPHLGFIELAICSTNMKCYCSPWGIYFTHQSRQLDALRSDLSKSIVTSQAFPGFSF
ncbi:unnamed protein product [Victoria cruziana]